MSQPGCTRDKREYLEVHVVNKCVSGSEGVKQCVSGGAGGKQWDLEVLEVSSCYVEVQVSGRT